MQNLTEEQRKALEEKLKNMSPEELKEFQKQQCIFCQITSGKVPSKKIYEDENCIAVLDINPANKGHILIIPKEHYVIMAQVPDETISHLFKISKQLSQLLLRAMKVEGTNVFIANGYAAGQKSQHFMIHLIPRKTGDNIVEFNEKLIDLDMKEKVRDVTKDKLNQILGVKKIADFDHISEDNNEGNDDNKKEESKLVERGVKIEREDDENIPKVEIVEAKKNKTSTKNKLVKKKVVKKAAPKKKAPAKTKDSSQKKSSKSSETTTKKKIVKKKITKKVVEEVTEEEDSGVSIDDIANLFT